MARKKLNDNNAKPEERTGLTKGQKIVTGIIIALSLGTILLGTAAAFESQLEQLKLDF